MVTEEEKFDAEIDRLAALQEFDRRLKQQLDRVEALVNEADWFEAQLAGQREGVAQLTADRDALEARRAEMDARLESDGGKVRDNRMRLNRIRNDRELLALEREIEMGREANRQLEEELIVVMENLEGLGQQLAEAEEALKGLEGQMETEVTARRSEAQRIRSQLEAERAHRNSLADGMDPRLHSMYAQIFERRGGTAVVAARQGICLGCHMNLPPQLFNELQRYRDIRQCPNCHRILYWRPEPEEF